MFSFDKVQDAILLVFDTLKDDPESKGIIEQLDTAQEDAQLKDGLKKAVERLNVVNPAVAKEVKDKAKGFAF